MQIDVVFAALLLVTSLAAAMGALALFSLVAGRKSASPMPAYADDRDEAVFLFEDEDLIDATAAARALIAASSGRGGDWARLTAFIARNFDGGAEALTSLADVGRIEIDGKAAGTGADAGDVAGSSSGMAATAGADARPLRLNADWRNGLTRITITDPTAEGRDLRIDRLSFRAMEDELDTLRATTEHLPVLVWRQAPDGSVVWANRAYVSLYAAAAPDVATMNWPLPALFDPATLPAGPTVTQHGERPSQALMRRVRLAARGAHPPHDRVHWFDCHAFPLNADRLFVACPADAAVKAETALKEFVQTLTKTFAHLPIGLAIFDRQRQLALFNPALTDLTTLGPEFLSGRPTLLGFLDHLRERRMMPEPKDYRSWRQQMAALEVAASNGQYEETWTLPGGQTYRVIGRPHPDGALALLFEDITAEVSLTRRFRSKIDIGQSVLDSLDEAICVFSHSGTMVFANDAFARLWKVDPATLRAEMGMRDAMRIWRAQTLQDTLWSDVEAFVGLTGEREGWRADITLVAGDSLTCRIVPLPGGATMAGFAQPVVPQAQAIAGAAPDALADALADALPDSLADALADARRDAPQVAPPSAAAGKLRVIRNRPRTRSPEPAAT